MGEFSGVCRRHFHTFLHLNDWSTNHGCDKRPALADSLRRPWLCKCIWRRICRPNLHTAWFNQWLHAVWSIGDHLICIMRPSGSIRSKCHWIRRTLMLSIDFINKTWLIICPTNGTLICSPPDIYSNQPVFHIRAPLYCESESLCSLLLR
jgi:hypothetical protein